MAHSIQVEARGDLLIVTESKGKFVAIYVNPASKSQLRLMRRSPSNDHVLLAEAWKVANAKARELGWIV